MRTCPTCRRVVDDILEVCAHDGTPIPPSDALLGLVVDGKYQVDALVGTGGMGTVYSATQLALNRRVAIKFLKNTVTSDPKALDRFRREALLLAGLKHPHIITVYDFGAAPDAGAYLVTEFVEGYSLRDEITQSGGRMRATDVVAYARAIAQAAAEAHHAGIIHRDLKPQNVMIEPSRSGKRVKVLDFGLAKLSGEDTSSSAMPITLAGLVVGTPLYVAPELNGGAKADARSDIYAIGCIVYEMLVGRPPFVSDDMWAILMMHGTQKPTPPSELVADIPPLLEAVVLRALEKSPDLRPQTAGELDDILAAAAQSVVMTSSLDVMAKRPVADDTPRASTMVGRIEELAELERRLSLAEAGGCQLVLVTGPGGIGKTRLVEEFELKVAGRGIQMRHGRFDKTGGAFPYSGFFDVVAEHLRADPSAAEGLR
jgi:serine/threonine protein kinase